MRTSVIIRVKNEADNLRKLMPILKSQDDQDFEIILVNDSSTDGSDRVPGEFFSPDRFRIVSLARKFNYPYASNLGAECSRGEFLVYLSAHSFPFSAHWLSDGLRHLANPEVGGVFAFPLANPESNLFERLMVNGYARLACSRVRVYKFAKMGVMGSTNAVYRKRLWQQHNFSESHAHGGEDYEWAAHWTARDYTMVQDPAFRVYHSHDLHFMDFIRQNFKYKGMLKAK